MFVYRLDEPLRTRLFDANQAISYSLSNCFPGMLLHTCGNITICQLVEYYNAYIIAIITYET